ncbi:MAG: fibronectin type III domain-containing protein [Coriobacteriales bacterium]
MRTLTKGSESASKTKLATCSILALALLCTATPALAQALSGESPARAGFALQGTSELASNAADVVASGSFEGNPSLRWTLAGNGSLAVAGSGVATCTDELLAVGDQVTSIFIGREVTALDADVFSFFTKLESVAFEEGSLLGLIGASAFEGCTSLTGICIPAGVENIGNSAFSGCFELASVEFEQGSALRSVGASSFSSCEKLRSITLPPTTEHIGDYAFYGCSSLESLSIPPKVAQVGEAAFEDCTALEEFVVENPAATKLPSSALTGTPQAAPAPSIQIKSLRATGHRTLKLSWSKASGASSYTVFYKKSGAKAFRQLKVRGASKTSIALKKLAKGKRYEVCVSAHKDGKVICKARGLLSPKVR